MRLILTQSRLLYFSLSGFFFFAIMLSCNQKHPGNLPQVLDDRMTMEVILEAPDIMTPIGLTIDDHDNIYVLESHTHLPMEDYQGPTYDRIKKGIDEDHDGRPDLWVIYADSINDGMNIEWHDGMIYLVEKDSIIAISDTDGDGIADQKKVLVEMKTAQEVFDHAGLLGITVSPDGWIYVSRGNCAGVELEILGTDGSKIDSYGDGGSVFRCRTDGSHVEHIASGFWNPFDIKFTKSGRLMLVDNDPDSRGPNRLLEIVPGGDYGYESLYGGSGLHPFLAWNGELPGTLHYAAGIGEAPSGLIDANVTNFPEDYRGNILATIWEENSIVRIPLTSFLSSVKGEPEIIIQGDSSFHPVAMAANSQGDLFITDWVKRQYPNHGYGRVFILTTEAETPIANELPAKGPYFAKLDNPPEIDQLISDLRSEDPFVQTLSRYLMVKGNYQDEALNMVQSKDSQDRMQGLLIFSQTDWVLPKVVLETLVADNESDIRRMTLIYLATHQRVDVYDTVVKALSDGFVTEEIFETYLETIKYLQPDFVESYLSREKAIAKQLKVHLPDNYIESIIKDEALSDDIRATALPYLEDVEPNIEHLLKMFPDANTKLKKALLLTLKNHRSGEITSLLLETSLDKSLDAEVRAQAILNLELQNGVFCDEIKYLIKNDDPLISETAGRYLCRCGGSDEDIVQMMDEIDNQKTKTLWNHCNGNLEESRPQTNESWLSVLNGNGNSKSGWMIFQSPKALCISCHQVNKWGGTFGPDLSHIGASKSKEQLAYAILQPDMEIAPEWQGWFIKDKDGVTHFGRQIDIGSGKNAELMLADGQFVNFKDIQGFGLAPGSLMPEGLENQLSLSEMNDLLTFLMSLK
ncbi:MAG: PVC-type heme-binding CxxCH protein [Bacteroidota bacterium]